MGFYWLQDGVHKKLDSVRSNFLWQGAEDKFRYHMAKWEMISRPKDQGGVGIINTRIMNDCLLVKWIWKIFSEPDDLWFKIIKAKYLGDGSFFDSKTKGSSQFWKGLHKVKHLFKWGAIFRVRNGNFCRFWQDCWVQNVPLSIAYNKLYSFVRDPACKVSDCWDEGSWTMDFKRALSAEDYKSWLEICDSLTAYSLNSGDNDVVVWGLEKKGFFFLLNPSTDL